jgi:hypothetical protein
LVTDSHNISARWRNHFSQLWNVHGVNDLTQTEIHIAETLVPEPRAFGVEMAIEMLKRYKSTGNGQFSADLIKAGGTTIRFQIHELIRSIWNTEKLPEE